jgi:hypothetical protein
MPLMYLKHIKVFPKDWKKKPSLILSAITIAENIQ